MKDRGGQSTGAEEGKHRHIQKNRQVSKELQHPGMGKMKRVREHHK